VSKQILVVGPAWVGDMVMAQVLFKMLQQQDPEVQIDVLAPAWSLPIIARMPEVRQAIVLPFKHGELKLRKRYQIARELRKTGYAQAISLTNSLKSALIPWLARIPVRTGWLGEMRWGLLNDIRYLNKQQMPLLVQRFAALAFPKSIRLPEKLPIPELQITSDTVQATLQKLGLSIPKQPLLVLCPGAEFGPAKRWPAQYYAKVANKKLAEGWQVWLLGSPKDQPVIDEIHAATEHQCVDLAGGRSSLEDAVDLLSLATIVVSNDSGAMHVAAALHRPVVVVYGSTDPGYTPPLNDHAEILTLKLSCSPCFQRECPLGHLKCLNDLPPELVLQSIDKLTCTS
jgi:heptosyltransferase-2